MSTFDTAMMVVGLLLAAVWMLYRATPAHVEKVIKFAWLIPVVALLLPPALLLLLVMVKAATTQGIALTAVKLIFVLSFLAAPVIGFMALIILMTQGNVGRNGWRQSKIRCALVFACLDVASPVLFIAGFVFLMALIRNMFG